MPVRSKWQLQCEGITADTAGRLLRLTLLNPSLTLPLLLLSWYTRRGHNLADRHPKVYRRLRQCLYIGLLGRLTAWLNKKSLNNWTSDEYDWSKELVVITGGSDGIGAYVVRLLAEKGIRVAVLDIQPLTYKAPSCVRFYNCDITSGATIHAAADQIRADFHPTTPSILINNAGLARGKAILSTSPADLSLTFAVNTLSHYPLCQAFVPAMVAANHGMVVTVASIAASITAPRMVDYSASKAAAVCFHEGLAAELATLYGAPRVRTVLVQQGFTRTALFDGFDPGDGFFSYALAPETVAEEIVRAVTSGESREVVLPAVHRWFALMVRGVWPAWLQAMLRRDLVKIMRNFKGREVKQPSVVGGGEGTGEVEHEKQA